MIKTNMIVVLYSGMVSIATCAEYWVEDDNRNVIGEAEIYLVYSDGTYEKTITRRSGFTRLEPKRREKVTLLVGGKGIVGFILKNCNSADDQKLKIRHKNGGSAIFDNGSGELMGIKGVFNPILDNLGRTYIYGRELSINNGEVQPVKFNIDETIHVKDNNKKTVDVIIRFIQHRVILLDYSEIGEGS